MVLELKYVSEKRDYFSDIIRFVKKSKHKKICYVTYEKTCGVLKNLFDKKNVEIDLFCCIDCISKSENRSEKEGNCQFIPVPYELKQVSAAIKRALKKGCTLVIFDSLSSLLKYGIMVPTGAIIEFVNSFLSALEKKKGDAIFICNKKDKGSLLVEEIMPVIDKVVGK